LTRDLRPNQLNELLRKFDSERMGVGGSTGDSDSGEQSQDKEESIMNGQNPGETAI